VPTHSPALLNEGDHALLKETLLSNKYDQLIIRMNKPNGEVCRRNFEGNGCTPSWAQLEKTELAVGGVAPKSRMFGGPNTERFENLYPLSFLLTPAEDDVKAGNKTTGRRFLFLFEKWLPRLSISNNTLYGTPRLDSPLCCLFVIDTCICCIKDSFLHRWHFMVRYDDHHHHHNHETHDHHDNCGTHHHYDNRETHDHRATDH
jgi:hypothetical protein